MYSVWLAAKNVSNKILSFWANHYIFILIILFPLAIYLNYCADYKYGMIQYYLDQVHFIKSNFNHASLIKDTPVYPIWGYAFIFLLLETKLHILFFQAILAIFSVWLFIRYTEKMNFVPTPIVNFIKIAITVSLPFYSLHTNLWGYSPAASFFLCTFILFWLSMVTKNKKLLFLSAVAFAFSINMRFTLILMIPVLFWIAYKVNTLKKETFPQLLLWCLIVGALMTPWILYTKVATGHYMLSYSNLGHTIILDLGRLPNNKWGIIPSDDDLYMRNLLTKKFGYRIPLDAREADNLLKRHFLSMIYNDPFEYIKKMGYNAYLCAIDGTYSGEYYKNLSCWPNCLKSLSDFKKNLISDPVGTLFNIDSQSFRDILYLFSRFSGIIIIFISILSVIATLLIYRSNKFIVSICAILIIHLSVNIFIRHKPLYTGLFFVFHLFNFTIILYFVVNKIKQIFNKRGTV